MNTPTTPPNRRVLVIDDNLAIHEGFRKILGDEVKGSSKLLAARAALFDEVPIAAVDGFDVTFADQGQVGFAKVQEAVAAGSRTRWPSWTCGCRPAGTASRPSNISGRWTRTCKWSSALPSRIMPGRRSSSASGRTTGC
jgi:hypothetical protein